MQELILGMKTFIITANTIKNKNEKEDLVMFCNQCEQTLQGKACTSVGVCGKSNRAGILQDLIMHGLKGIAIYGKEARKIGIKGKMEDNFLLEGLFTTVTNVNFDEERLLEMVYRSYDIKKEIKRKYEALCQEKNIKPVEITHKTALWKPDSDIDGLLKEGESLGIMEKELNEDINSLKMIITYGLKGMAAYADHASILGYMEEEILSFFYDALTALSDDGITQDELIGLTLNVGEINLKCMELLDKAHTSKYGHPVPTKVSTGIKKGPAILISGHDLLDLEELLIQTEGKGINIYTHGEMLPAHGYPALNKYGHLAGNYGSAWQNQRTEFEEFRGPILMTTNCIQKPKDSYRDRIFTTGLVAFDGVKHIPDRKNNSQKDFSEIIQMALKHGGFPEDKPENEITVGFGHNAVLGVADKVIDLVKSKKLRHIFLVGGCDGAKPGRNYYTEIAEKIPKDCIILTLACGKYRFNKIDFGTIDGIPRLLDIGQCNDAYSAIKIAVALSNAFNISVNDLPLSIILSWYEQKAVVILLTLLHLGIKNIKLGPTLPAFITPNILSFLVEKFNIAPTTAPDKDIKEILG